MKPAPCPLCSEIAPETLAGQLRGGQPIQLVDVRTSGEFASAHIAGAMLLPLRDLARRHAELDPHLATVCVCQSGQLSKTAQRQLSEFGLTATSLKGGVNGWIRAGLPVDKQLDAPWSLERQVRVAAGILVLTGISLGWFVHPAFYAIGAFVGTGLIFAGVTDWCGMGLLLARAPWNRS